MLIRIQRKQMELKPFHVKPSPVPPLNPLSSMAVINKCPPLPLVQTGSVVRRTGRQATPLGTPDPNTIVVMTTRALRASGRH